MSKQALRFPVWPYSLDKNVATSMANAVGGGLLIQFFVTVFLAHLSFFAYGSTDGWQCLAGFLISALWIDRVARRLPIDPLRALLLYLAGFAICGLGALFWKDLSYDGQWYHTEAILSLRHGWNPVTDPEGASKYVTMYPHAVEIYGTAAWQMLWCSIEISKMAAWTTALASFLLTFMALVQTTRLSVRASLALAFVAALNPVTLSQLRTTMIDGTMASIILALVALIALYIDSPNRSFAILIAAATFLLADVKTTGYIAALGLSIFLAVPWYRAMPSLSGSATAQRVGLILLATTLVGSVVIWHPYVTHLLRFSNPIYPILDEEAKVVIGPRPQEGLQGLNIMEKLVRSELSRPQNSYQAPLRPLRSPLLFEPDDRPAYFYSDTRIKGFGPFTLPLEILSLVGIGFLFRWNRRRAMAVAGIGVVIVLSVLGAGEGWWARFVPHVWLLPLIVAAALDQPWGRNCRWGIVAVAALNILAVGAIGYSNDLKLGKLMNAQIQHLKTRTGPVQIVYVNNPMPRAIVRLREQGLSVEVVTLAGATRLLGVKTSLLLMKDPEINRELRLANCEALFGTFQCYVLPDRGVIAH
jgi:hypothetical protein